LGRINMRAIAYLVISVLAIAMLALVGCGGDEEGTVVIQPTARPAAAPATAPATALPAAAPAPTAVPFRAATAVPVAAPVYPTAVPAQTAPAEPKKGGVIRWMPQASTPNLDANHGARTTSQIVAHFMDTPFNWNQDLQSKEQMVDAWSWDSDTTTFTFSLRDGMTFHDGTPVTSSDVMASIERWRHSLSASMPKRMWDLSAGPTMSKTDDLTFDLSLNKPFALWVSYWAGNPTFVMPKETADSLEEEDVNTNYNASGPFKFVEWFPGNTVILDRYDVYNPRSDPKDGAAGARIVHVDRLEYVEVPDPATRVAALRTGQGDFSEAIPNDFYQTLLDDPDVRAEIIPGWAIPFLATNKLYPPLNNPKARMALVAATDPEKYLRAGYGAAEMWSKCPDLFMCNGSWPSTVGNEVYSAPVDMEKAKRLWNEAVEESGFTGKIVLLTNTDFADFYAAALITRDILEELGAEVDFVVTDWAGVISRKVGNLHKDPSDGGWHFYQSWGEAWDPIQDSRLGTTWNGGWDNEEAQKLIEQFAFSKSNEEAQAIVDELQRIFWYEDPAVIPYGTFSYLVGVHRDVRNYTPHKRMMLDGVWLDR
jgi:peptide/nickel transport system substrate-binding protein